jgi:hypothetical protein
MASAAHLAVLCPSLRSTSARSSSKTLLSSTSPSRTTLKLTLLWTTTTTTASRLSLRCTLFLCPFLHLPLHSCSQDLVHLLSSPLLVMLVAPDNSDEDGFLSFAPDEDDPDDECGSPCRFGNDIERAVRIWLSSESRKQGLGWSVVIIFPISFPSRLYYRSA